MRILAAIAVVTDSNVVPITPEDWATFDNFWLSWPSSRRVEKKDARMIWQRMTQSQRERAITVLPRWLVVHGPRDYTYLCSPRRWLHGERFDDEMPPESAVSVATAAFKADMDKALAERTPMPESLRVKLGMKQR